MAWGTPWWSIDRESKDDVSEDGKSADDGGEGDEDDEEDDKTGDSEECSVRVLKRRLESRLQAPEKSNLSTRERDETCCTEH